MLVRGTTGLEIEVEEQVATAMIAAGLVEAVAADDGFEPIEGPEGPEEPEPEPESAKTKK